MTYPLRPTQKCSSYAPVPKLLKWSPQLNKMATRAKNRKIFKGHLLIGQLPNFKIISHKCSFCALLPKLLKWFCSTEQKNFKQHLLQGQLPDFKITSQKCSSYATLPKFLKWFRSAEQDSCQSKT